MTRLTVLSEVEVDLAEGKPNPRSPVAIIAWTASTTSREVLSMTGLGLEVKGDSGGKRVELQCEHHNGLLYVTPSESTWVCSDQMLHVHALAGFFKQLAQLDDARVKEAMQRSGLHFRERPLAPPAPTPDDPD